MSVDSCLSYPCLNGGTCNRNLITGGYTCSCSSGYNGDRCEIGKGLLQFQLKLAMSGLNLDNILFFHLITGDVCSLSQPCLNGGTCLFLHHWPYFRCSCSAGYLGHNCWYQIRKEPNYVVLQTTKQYIDQEFKKQIKDGVII